ncbi:MAG TPA: DoxX family membrane protein [Polyangia bacterium]|jgi:uncharacterized membrane protein YphA (DoxX/SURF4 family)
MFDRSLHSPYWALRIAFGVVPVVAGLDKFFNLLTNWEAYLSPLAARVLPVSPAAFMHVAGVIEILVGLAILTRFTRLASYAASAWLALIALNLLTSGRFFDVAARDAVMAVAAYTLARLEEVRLAVTVREPRAAAPRMTPAHAGG